MPFFKHHCNDCGCRFHAFQRRSDPPLALCPYCNGSLVRLDAPVVDARKGRRGASLPWKPGETEIHRGWKKRRKWKRDAIAAWKREERARLRRSGERRAGDGGGGRRT